VEMTDSIVGNLGTRLFWHGRDGIP
jgi:hypothetical protein